jgi:phosphotriesterase-related protein
MGKRDFRAAGLSRRDAMRLVGVGAGLGLATSLQREAGLLSAFQTTGKSSTVAFPKGAIIRTILKDLPPDALGTGATLFHEHLSSVNRPFSEDVELMIDEVRAAGKDGVACIVDGGNEGLKRNIQHLRTIGARSGVLIVASGGYYTQPTYSTSVERETEDELVEELVRDAHAERWGAFGEIGSSAHMHPLERKAFSAIGRAQVRTGLPILTHTPYHGTTGCQDGPGARCAEDQLDIFESKGVKPRSVCIGHLSDVLDPKAETVKAIAKRGAFVGFDTIRPPMEHMDRALRLLMDTLEAGYEDHVIFSHDGLDEKLLKKNGGPGYSMTLSLFVPKMRAAGVKEETVHKMLVDNPRRFLAFVPKAA